jgi:hypothetical protein
MRMEWLHGWGKPAEATPVPQKEPQLGGAPLPHAVNIVTTGS